MRLYLSSFRVGNAHDHLVALLHGGDRVAVIANSMDAYARRGLETEIPALLELGLRPEELDLRDFFATPQATKSALASFDLLWLRGGNVFALRHAMAHSGADDAIVELLRDDAVVYGGYSAGPCVLAPSLRGLEQCDDPSPVEAMYGEPANYAGLGVLDFAFVPHVDSPGHPETEALGRVAREYEETGVAYRAFRDGQVLVVDGQHEELVE